MRKILIALFMILAIPLAFAGSDTTYNENGHIVYEQHYENGVVSTHGYYNEEGYRTGTWTNYYENGKVASIENYEDGMKSGSWSCYDIDSNMTALANFKNDKKHGEWKMWDDRGRLICEIVYRHGHKVEAVVWSEDGLIAKLY